MQNATTIHRDLPRFLLVEQFDANAIGQRIKHARIQAGLTQEDLADLAEGFGRRSLQAYETGASIPFKHLHEIGLLLKRDVPWFLYGDPEPTVDASGEILVRLEALEAQIEMRGEAFAKGLDALARDVRYLTRLLEPVHEQARKA